MVSGMCHRAAGAARPRGVSALDEAFTAHQGAQGVVLGKGVDVLDHGLGQDVGVFFGEVGMGEQAVGIGPDEDGGGLPFHGMGGHAEGDQRDVPGGGLFDGVFRPVEVVQVAPGGDHFHGLGRGRELAADRVHVAADGGGVHLAVDQGRGGFARAHILDGQALVKIVGIAAAQQGVGLVAPDGLGDAAHGDALAAQVADGFDGVVRGDEPGGRIGVAADEQQRGTLGREGLLALGGQPVDALGGRAHGVLAGGRIGIELVDVEGLAGRFRMRDEDGVVPLVDDVLQGRAQHVAPGAERRAQQVDPDFFGGSGQAGTQGQGHDDETKAGKKTLHDRLL